MEKQAYLLKKIGKSLMADSTALYAKFTSLLVSTMKNEGNTSTVAALNALVNPMPNLVIKLTDSGTLTAGALKVVLGETVYFNGETWNKISIGGPEIIELVTANKTLSASDSGKTFLIGADALVITLPATSFGLKFTFVNFGAAGAQIMTISPQAADGIAGTVTLAASVVVLDGTVDKDLVNTKATSQAGDRATILGSGIPGTKAWILTESGGIFAQGA